ncbi:restriction endonuclease [Streptomyces roseirectus]|uniref:Restriction endonuclease n=1 Tax=Streptomyces roseirectus TaxID=2768066 RepID=A0A7H0I5V4_9ACTN|nr:restriction endonuclease [Streptomyces roseirectus]QNP68170.1 restriction endonuclease [Streptomyces roseirectus]
MARRRLTRARKRRLVRVGGGVLVGVGYLVWQYPWVVVGLVCVAVAGGGGWCLWAAHRRERLGDLAWRSRERRIELERSMAGIDAMSWQDFERYVAELCRRDGCTGVTVVGGAGDLAADVIGRLPDGRRLVVQVKHYAPHRKVPSGDMQKFVGMAYAEHHADVALYVTTCEYSAAARALALKHGITALNRDLFGSWNNGAPLLSLLPLGGAGGGPPRGRNRHRA